MPDEVLLPFYPKCWPGRVAIHFPDGSIALAVLKTSESVPSLGNSDDKHSMCARDNRRRRSGDDGLWKRLFEEALFAQTWTVCWRPDYLMTLGPCSAAMFADGFGGWEGWLS